ncbi:hypothetical protein TNCV_4023831 [Trichonephila clavipes]|nr:hypothetical protein TNCV_4023831 [Trichonephila clavipes]
MASYAVIRRFEHRYALAGFHHNFKRTPPGTGQRPPTSSLYLTRVLAALGIFRMPSQTWFALHSRPSALLDEEDVNKRNI